MATISIGFLKPNGHLQSELNWMKLSCLLGVFLLALYIYWCFMLTVNICNQQSICLTFLSFGTTVNSICHIINWRLVGVSVLDEILA